MPDDTTVLDGRAPRGRKPRRGLQLAGLALIVYGVVGIVLFVGVAVAVGRPLDRIQRLSQSAEEVRASAVESLDQAEATIGGISDGVGRMDDSLGQANAAIGRASTIANGVAASMFQLRDSSNITIFGQAPFAGLSTSFDVAGTQLGLLAGDLTSIGVALETNRTDVVATAENMEELATTIGDLSDAVNDAPSVDVSPSTINNLRLGIYAICGWLVVLGIACVFGGLYLVRHGRRRRHIA